MGGDFVTVIEADGGRGADDFSLLVHGPEVEVVVGFVNRPASVWTSAPLEVAFETTTIRGASKSVSLLTLSCLFEFDRRTLHVVLAVYRRAPPRTSSFVTLSVPPSAESKGFAPLNDGQVPSTSSSKMTNVWALPALPARL